MEGQDADRPLEWSFPACRGGCGGGRGGSCRRTGCCRSHVRRHEHERRRPGLVPTGCRGREPCAGPDQVSFVVDGTIRLTSGAIVVAATLAIEGPGADRLTLSGNGTSGILQTQPTTNLPAAGVTFADGSALVVGAEPSTTTAGRSRSRTWSFVATPRSPAARSRITIGGTLAIRGSTFDGNTALPVSAISNYEENQHPDGHEQHIRRQLRRRRRSHLRP